MDVTEPINIVIAVAGSIPPLIYLFFANRFANQDLEHTDEIADTGGGQTHHTAIINTEVSDGHAAHAADEELHLLHHAPAH